MLQTLGNGQNWLDLAKALPAGRTERVRHCGTDNSMLVSHTETGYSCHCFRCNEHGFESHGRRTIKDIMRHKAELEVRNSSVPFLPRDYSLNIPMDAAVWFMQYGISPELAQQYKIGWSEYFNRIVIPVYEDWDHTGPSLSAVQMRAINPNDKPKYLNPGGAAIRKALFWATTWDREVLVLTEDVLSAIKVGRKFDACSLLGTTMTDERAAKIAMHYDTVVLWLDGDKAGRAGVKDAAKQLAFQGVKCYKVISERDPKTYTQSEIEDHIRRMQPC